MKIAGIGIDIVEIRRFRSLVGKKSNHFFERNFSELEQVYCRSYRDAAMHFAGTFAAKEAASKALGVKKFPYMALEIRRTKDGKPEVWKKNRKIPVLVSITHTKELAIAFAVC